MVKKQLAERGGKGLMSKTIKQIADELGVSKQAVHQKRKSKELSTALQPFTSTVDGAIYISVDGEKLIKQAFLNSGCKHVDDNQPSTIYTEVDSNLYGILKATIDTLQEQLNVKDKQIVELTETIKMQAQSINIYQQKELAGKLIEGKQLINNQDEYEEKQVNFKKHWWQKIKK